MGFLYHAGLGSGRSLFKLSLHVCQENKGTIKLGKE